MKKFKEFISEMSTIDSLGFKFLKKTLSDGEIKQLDDLMDKQDKILNDIDNEGIFAWMDKFTDVKNIKDFSKSQKKLADMLNKKKNNALYKKALDITNKITKIA
jgi:hypothetical protein